MRGPGQVSHSQTAPSGRSGEGDQPLSVGALVGVAREATGLDDLGDAGAIEALGVLVDSIEAHARLDGEGRRCIGQWLEGLLEQRLRMVDFAATSEVVDYEAVRSPIVITGLPHSGTTMLADLVAQDPFNRAVLGWEAATVAPPPGLADMVGGPRPSGAPARHPLAGADVDRALPADCSHLLAPSFAGLIFETALDVPDYADWCDEAEMTESYRFHHLALRTLQTTVPTERWVLESPAHLWHLDTLRLVYPDARLIVTHRDPAKVVPGVAAMSAALRSRYSDMVDPEAVGRHWRARCQHALEISAAHLATWDPGALFHLPHAELVDDPVGSVERIYQRFGIDLSDLGRRRMAAWQEQHPGDRRAGYGHATGDLALDEAGLRREFATYMSDHHVPSEH